MTEVQPNDPLPTAEPTPETPAAETKKPPEPWTPAKVSEWNAYYDIYVAVGVLVLAFLGSANMIVQPSVWTHLHAGRVISRTMTPIATDTFSYTEAGHRWVNIPWITEVIHYQVYRLVSGLAQVDPNSLVDSTAPEIVEAKRAQEATTEQVGAAGLIALDATLRAITVLILMLGLRRKGPGLWWSAVCVTLALGAAFGPAGVIVGGIAGPAPVDSDTWGHLLLVVELLLLFRVYGQGRARALYAMGPLFLIWANTDESFFTGLLLLAASVVGSTLVRRPANGLAPPVSPSRGLIALGVSAAACLVNPSFHRIFAAAIGTLVPQLGWVSGVSSDDQLSYFGKKLSSEPGVEYLWGYYFAVVGIGFASFALNRRRFSLPRFLVYTVAAGLWAIMARLKFEFAPVFAATLALNGQEWYHDVVGSEGRLGRSWSSWSIGGRAATIVLIFLVIFQAVTGYDVFRGGTGLGTPGGTQFGFGFDPDAFPFEAADALKAMKIEGNVMNTQAAEGDAINWRAGSTRKTFIDSRRHVFSAETIRRFDEIRIALRDDDPQIWRELLKDDNVAAVMIEFGRARRTYQALSVSPSWIPFYDDGATVMFGRADASPADLAYFNSHRLDADRLVYKQPTPVPSTDKLPRATGDLDKIYQSRAMARPQPHSDASARWIHPSDVAPNAPFLPEPARCLMAIREARIAISRKTDDTMAYRRLVAAYRMLFLEESAMVAGLAPKTENVAAISQINPQAGLLPARFRQLVTALNYAIQTTPPPATHEARHELSGLHMSLAEFYAGQGFVDLARDHLSSAIDLSSPEDYTPEQFAGLTQQLNGFTAQLTEVQSRIAAMGLESQAGPIQRAGLARQMGAVGLAIQELESAVADGMNPNLVKPVLLDLYCQVGQPDKALDLWTAAPTADPVLADGPGTAALRQGMVFFLLGNYQAALLSWEKEAIPRLKFDRALKAPAATRSMLEGDPMVAARTFLELPDEVTKQALWEFDAALASLEAGQPVDDTAAHFTAALTLAPDLTVRPVIAYYLEKLGKPVPEAPKAAKPAATTPPATPVPAAVPAPAVPK